MATKEQAERLESIGNDCCRIAGKVYGAANQIRDTICAVGSGELSADNALHKLVVVFGDLLAHSEELSDLFEETETLKCDIMEGK